MPWKSRGPISLSNGVSVNDGGSLHAFRLRVVAAEALQADTSASDGCLLVSANEPALSDWAWEQGSPPHIGLASGSDVALMGRKHEGYPI